LAYNTKNIKRDQGNIGIPQYYDSVIDDYVPAEGSDGAIHVKLISQLPAGATHFIVPATSLANAAGVATVAAVTGKQHHVMGYLVCIRGASAGNDILVTLKDDTTVKLTDVIGNASPSGSAAEKVSSMPILIGTASKDLSLNVGAGGSGVISELTVWGYTL